ncbi:uncharacterized protein IWZ02DRAFT_483381 [Phyllosticta citriasiana]|uniref:uncharacterized protein n=1 Tax=Phyllosticta citriasiana TaxID=595635 RepID=UPI0030FDAD31
MLQSFVIVLFPFFVPSVRSLPVCLSSRHVRGPRRTPDPDFNPGLGSIVGSDRLVLKVNCPNCPLDEAVDGDKWNTNDTALVQRTPLRFTFAADQWQIYDLIVSVKASQEFRWHVARPQKPGNYAILYPPGPLIGDTPFTPSVNIIGPSSLTVDKYLFGDANYFPVEVPGMVKAISIPNRFDWNITQVSYINGLCFANGPDPGNIINIPVALVYLLHHADLQTEIVWWELQDVNDFRTETSEPKMPPLLERKLFHDNRAWLQPQCDCKTLSDQMARWLVFGALVIVLLVAGAIFERRVVQRGGQISLCDSDEEKIEFSSNIDDEGIDEELEERLERHP